MSTPSGGEAARGLAPRPRFLAEHFENPPIFWHNCPYAGFKNS